MSKRTTIVHFGLDATPELAVMYLFVGFVFSVFAAVYMHLIPGALLIVVYAIPALAYGCEINRTSELTPEVCAQLRLKGMFLAVVYGLAASIAIVMEGLI